MHCIGNLYFNFEVQSNIVSCGPDPFLSPFLHWTPRESGGGRSRYTILNQMIFPISLIPLLKCSQSALMALHTVCVRVRSSILLSILA